MILSFCTLLQKLLSCSKIMNGIKKEYVFPVSKVILEVKKRQDYKIYKKLDDKRFQVLVDKNKYLNKETFCFNSSDEKVFINSKDKVKYEEDIHKFLSNMISDKTICINKKANLINEIARNCISELFENEITAESLKNINNILTNSIDLILSDKKALESMFKITSYDYYTSTHCLDVSTYAIGFGHYLGLNKNELLLLGKGALLHDIGKKYVDKNITCKNGRLTFNEMNIMKKHPTYSKDILMKLGETNIRLLNIVSQHHEKCDGTGYPYGLQKDEIDDFSKIVSICDIFNALTTKRTYKKPMKSFDAIKLMYTQMENELCSNYLEKFVMFLKLPN